MSQTSYEESSPFRSPAKPIVILSLVALKKTVNWLPESASTWLRVNWRTGAPFTSTANE